MAKGIRSIIDDLHVGKGVDKVRTLFPKVVWLVPSGTELGHFYIVVRSRKYGWVCCCKGFIFGGRQDEKCRHVDKVIEQKGKKK